MYVAETDKLSVFHYTPTSFKADQKKKLLDLPAGGNHVTRSLLLTKDGDDDILLISIGSSCNVCREKDTRRATIQYYNLRTGETGEYARGLRNAVFMATRPGTNQIWATEMGRDLLGDDIPPDEIDIIQKGKNYGWPNCYGQNIHDTAFDKNTYIRNPCMEPFETPSQIDLQAHSAPLGLAFVPSSGWPRDIRGDLLVAFHGSWNRTVPTGYKIVRVKLDRDGKPEGVEDFITGWLANGKKLGRPVDILMRDEGGLFISDDGAGIVYFLKPVGPDYNYLSTP
jgi:glucose/arabinose dehydrogenase